MDITKNIRKSAAILLKDRKLLVVKEKDKEFFISPGGKPEPGESLEETLIRELREELGLETTPEQFELFGTFTATAAGHDNVIVEITAFLVNNWNPESIKLNPHDKVNEYCWVDTSSATSIELGSIFKHEVVPKLKNLDLLD